jgi:aminoglycoside 3-N-acetyltransferase
VTDGTQNLFEGALIREGSTLLLHSSTARLLRQHRVTPVQILEAILDRLGAEGTLLLPLFNFDFTNGVPFDVRSTPSHMGALTEAGRAWPGSVRTGHPVYSFAAIGKHADQFARVDNKSAYGAQSPFSILRQLDGEIAVIDLPDQNSMTFYHHVEEMMEVPYRFHKEFTGEYTDWAGETAQRTYSIFVRDLDAGVRTSVDRMGDRLWAQGLYRGEKPKAGTGMRIIGANAMFEEVSKVIASGKAEQFLFEYAE